MLRKKLANLKTRHMEIIREQKGQSIIIFTFAIIGLIAMLGLALDLGLVYIEKVKVNRVTDAAALASVVELPYEQDTISRAIDYISQNGYDVGVDTEILVRGCLATNFTYVDSRGVSHIYNLPGGSARNVSEDNANPITRTTQIAGAQYISIIPALPAGKLPKATFVIDTGGYQTTNKDSDDDEECAADNLGTSNKVRVAGRVNVHMNFMQFFGFRDVPVQDEAIAENMTNLDVMVVFDISGSMEDQSICTDCYFRTSYSPNWPNNGYLNPIPFNPTWATGQTVHNNHSVPQSTLCISPTTPFITLTHKYLSVEAELYSANNSNWSLAARTPGYGFWSIQRGSHRGDRSTNTLGENNRQDNQAGQPNNQSSNVCRPAVTGANNGGIDCILDNGNSPNDDDNVCSSADGGYAADCSAYIAARPMLTYGQAPGAIPNLAGAAYNADCFVSGGACWSNNPFNTIPELAAGPGPAPSVEYDFTPTWTQTTYIWIRAQGGGEEAYTWAGRSPDQIQPDLNGGGVNNNITPWRKVIYWEVVNVTPQVYERNDNVNAAYSNLPNETNTDEHMQSYPDWRANRAINGSWRWIRLNDDDGTIRTLSLISGTQYTLKLYEGSAGYMVDKIVFTNDSSGSTPEGGGVNPTIPAALRRDGNSGTVAVSGDKGQMLGPPASPGSATREACNLCNPIYGYQIGSSSQCSCKWKPWIAGSPNDFLNGHCRSVLTSTNLMQEELQAGLYSGVQPLRSAQEAVKNFARKLNPRFDQLGIVAFTSGGDTDAAQNSANKRRTRLMCLRWATEQYGNPARCYDPTQSPISYTEVFSAVEKQWPNSATSIAIGLREALEELGVADYSANSDCAVDNTHRQTSTAGEGGACDRRGAAKRVIVLMTDGSPNNNPGNCTGAQWKGLIGTDDADFVCGIYYAQQAAARGVTIYTIGIGAGANQDYLTAIATGIDPHGDQPDVTVFTNNSPGSYFPAAKPTDLDIIFDKILSNIYVRIVS